MDPGLGAALVRHLPHLLQHVVQQVFEFVECGLLDLLVRESLALLVHVEDCTADSEAQGQNGVHAFAPVCLLLVRNVHPDYHVGVTLYLTDEVVDVDLVGFVIKIF